MTLKKPQTRLYSYNLHRKVLINRTGHAGTDICEPVVILECYISGVTNNSLMLLVKQGLTTNVKKKSRGF